MSAEEAWSEARAGAHLASLERFGMRLGLGRMRRLLAALGTPERQLSAIHVVGTNGKSSTVRFAAALLEANGVATGAYLSPHLIHWAERIRVRGEDLAPEAFGAGVQRAAEAAARIDAVADADDRVTQFELVTAAALAVFVRAGVGAVVVEAGLGGRLDATNVLDAPVVVLTNIDLEHTEHLGGTLAAIAREKLAVLGPRATLVTGPLAGEVEAEAQAAAERLGATRIRVSEGAAGPPGYQRRNFAMARAAVEAWLGRPLDPSTADALAREASVPGRLQVTADTPLTLLDGAHNVAGMEALVASLPAVAESRRPVVGVVSVLDGKDAAGMLRVLTPAVDALVFTRCANPRALAPAALAALAADRSGAGTEVVESPHGALARARAVAGPGGVVLATGSIHLVADLLAPEGSRAVTAY